MRSIPAYVFVAIGFLGLYALVNSLVILKDALLPLAIAIVIAILLQPIVVFFVGKGLNRVLSIIIPLTLILLLSLFLIAMLSSQVNHLIDSFPSLINKWDGILVQLSTWISENFDLTLKQSEVLILQEKKNLFLNGRSLLASTLLNFGQFAVLMLLIPIYVFMILYYRPLFVEVVFGNTVDARFTKLQNLLKSTQGIIKSYIMGLLIESGIVAILNVSGLLLLGIDYAVLLGIIGGALNIIPYVGSFVAMLLPILVAVVTKPIIFSLYLLIMYTLIQALDNNIVIPYIVASKVQINGLVSIFVVILGGLMWGVAGMFFSIPVTAIIKVFFDHYPGLEVWGKLLGTQETLKLKKSI
jgi:predicted PurR-regulated permease PerM